MNSDIVSILFSEAHSFAHYLTSFARQVQRSDSLPRGGKPILQSLVRHGSQTVPQIARGHAVSRQNVQILVNRLHTLGLVELIENPAHKRSSVIKLTETGKVAVESIAKREADIFSKRIRTVSDEELAMAASILRRLLAELIGQVSALQPVPESTLPKRSADALRRQKRKTGKIETPHGGISYEDEGEDSFPTALL